MSKEYRSKAVRAVERSESIRTTVPREVTAVLDLGIGDTLVWSTEAGSASVAVRAEPAKKPSKRR
jgi:hypothetical protein